MGAVPGIQLALQPLTLGQQRAVAWRQVVDQGVEAAPEGIGGDAGSRQHLVVDEAFEAVVHPQALTVHALGHSLFLLFRYSPLPPGEGLGVRGRVSLSKVIC
ncbi:hypothetical protein D9M70_519450 [compost metagenome]